MTEPAKWDCAIGTPDEDHDWEYKSDWYGDPGVINGTADIYFRRCRVCGKEEQVSAEDMPTYEDYE